MFKSYSIYKITFLKNNRCFMRYFHFSKILILMVSSKAHNSANWGVLGPKIWKKTQKTHFFLKLQKMTNNNKFFYFWCLNRIQFTKLRFWTDFEIILVYVALYVWVFQKKVDFSKFRTCFRSRKLGTQFFYSKCITISSKIASIAGE